jgi:hypothetical protein
MQLGSPFNYAKQVECFVDLRERVRLPGAREQRIERDEDVFTWEAAPKPRYASRGGSHNEGERVASLILDHVKATDGGTLCCRAVLVLRCLAAGRALVTCGFRCCARRDRSRTLI